MIFDHQPRQKTVFFLLILLAGFTVIFVLRQRGGQFYELREEKARLEAEQAELKARKETLSRRKRQLRGDPYLIRKIARRRLGLVVPGEKRLWLDPPTIQLETDGSRNSSETSPAPPQNFPAINDSFPTFKD